MGISFIVLRKKLMNSIVSFFFLTRDEKHFYIRQPSHIFAKKKLNIPKAIHKSFIKCAHNANVSLPKTMKTMNKVFPCFP